MPSEVIYNMTINKQQYRGNLDEMSEISGINKNTLRAILYGQIPQRDGVVIRPVYEETVGYNKLGALQKEFDDALRPFKKVEWVKELGPGVKKLVIGAQEG